MHTTCCQKRPLAFLITLFLFACTLLTVSTTCSAQSPSSVSLYPDATSYFYQPWRIGLTAIDPVRSLIYFIDSSAWLRQFSSVTQLETSPKVLLAPIRLQYPAGTSSYYQLQGNWLSLTVAFNGNGDVYVTTQCYNVSTCIDAIYVYNTSLSHVRTLPLLPAYRSGLGRSIPSNTAILATGTNRLIFTANDGFFAVIDGMTGQQLGDVVRYASSNLGFVISAVDYQDRLWLCTDSLNTYAGVCAVYSTTTAPNPLSLLFTQPLPAYSNYDLIRSIALDSLNPPHLYIRTIYDMVTVASDGSSVLTSYSDAHFSASSLFEPARSTVWYATGGSLGLWNGQWIDSYIGFNLSSNVTRDGPEIRPAGATNTYFRVKINADTMLSYDPISDSLFFSEQRSYRYVTALVSVDRRTGVTRSVLELGYGKGDNDNVVDYWYRYAVALDINQGVINSFGFYSTNNTYYASWCNTSNRANNTVWLKSFVKNSWDGGAVSFGRERGGQQRLYGLVTASRVNASIVSVLSWSSVDGSLLDNSTLCTPVAGVTNCSSYYGFTPYAGGGFLTIDLSSYSVVQYDTQSSQATVLGSISQPAGSPPLTWLNISDVYWQWSTSELFVTAATTGANQYPVLSIYRLNSAWQVVAVYGGSGWSVRCGRLASDGTVYGLSEDTGTVVWWSPQSSLSAASSSSSSSSSAAVALRGSSSSSSSSSSPVGSASAASSSVVARRSSSSSSSVAGIASAVASSAPVRTSTSSCSSSFTGSAADQSSSLLPATIGPPRYTSTPSFTSSLASSSSSSSLPASRSSASSSSRSSSSLPSAHSSSTSSSHASDSSSSSSSSSSPSAPTNGTEWVQVLTTALLRLPCRQVLWLE